MSTKSNKDILLEIQKELIEIKKDIFVIKSKINLDNTKGDNTVVEDTKDKIPEDKSSEGWLLWSSK